MSFKHIFVGWPYVPFFPDTRILARISILLWFKVPRERFENIRNQCHTPIGLHTQTKPNPRYFRQYRNPGQDASGKNGTYGHPNFTDPKLWVFKYSRHSQLKLLGPVLLTVYASANCLLMLKLYCQVFIKDTQWRISAEKVWTELFLHLTLLNKHF